MPVRYPPHVVAQLHRDRNAPVPHKLISDPHISPTALVLYGSMWLLIDDESDTCTASIRELATFRRISPTTVQRSINQLEARGWIGVVRGGNGRRNQYTMYLDPSDGAETADE